MDCKNCDNCEKNPISQLTQFSFLGVGRNRNTTQFDFQEGRNCESCENYYIEVFFEKLVNRSWILDFQNFSNFIFGSNWTRKDTLETKTKVGRVFPMVFCPNSSWFIQIKFRKKTQIAIRNFHNFRNLWNCGFRNFANNTIGFWANFTTLPHLRPLPLKKIPNDFFLKISFQLMIGKCYMKMNEKDKAKIFFEKVKDWNDVIMDQDAYEEACALLKKFWVRHRVFIFHCIELPVTCIVFFYVTIT